MSDEKEYPFLLETLKDPDSFGRYLGKVRTWETCTLNLMIKTRFNSVEYQPEKGE